MFIKVAKDFTNTPGGRFISKGPFSGELFRNELLIKKYEESRKKNEILIIDLDDCKRAYPPSFIDEAFGGLALHVGSAEVLNYIEIISNDEPKLLGKIKESIKKKLGIKNES